MTSKYIDSKIYTIRCKSNTNFIYVGSTYQKLSKRWCNHKQDIKRYPERPIYKTISENGGFDNFYIELFETFKCNTKEELLKREGEIMRNVGNMTMNFEIAGNKIGKTESEYQAEYREKNKEKLKLYRENIKEEFNQYQKEFNAQKIICECNCVVRKGDISKHKKTQKHIELMKQKEEQAEEN